MIHCLRNTIASLDDLGLPFIIGGESLIGLVEGDLFKYSQNVRLYAFPISYPQKIHLGFRLLRKGIVLKTKRAYNGYFYKLRHKPGFFKKDPNFIEITPLKLEDGSYNLYESGNHCVFTRRDLQPTRLTRIDHEGLSLSVPLDSDTFTQRYQNELMSAFYVKHAVNFNSDTEKTAVRLLHKSVDILNATGYDYWIEGGTLLGAVRDGKFIPWDHDLDMGMKYVSDQQMREVIRKLRKHYYVSVRSFSKDGSVWDLGKFRMLKIYPRKYRFFKKKPGLDLFIYYPGEIPGEDEAIYKYVVWKRNAYHRREFLDELDSIEFYGKDIPTPSDPEGFLEVKYGANWRTPVKEWNVALDDGSIYQEEA